MYTYTVYIDDAVRVVTLETESVSLWFLSFR